jgi:hypothetical protein
MLEESQVQRDISKTEWHIYPTANKSKAGMVDHDNGKTYIGVHHGK